MSRKAASAVKTFRFSRVPLDVAALRRTLADRGCGGFASFEGWVRDHNEGQRVRHLEYEAFEPLAVKEGERILAEAGLKTRLHAYGTNIEGDWDQVFAAVKRCHEALHAAGVPRISTTMKFGTRTDREQTMEDKVASVERKLGS